MREARADINARASAIDPKALAGQAQATVAGAPEHLKALPTKAQELFAEAVATALAAYGDLTARGNDLVGRVRGQQATSDLKAQASTTVSHAKGTATTAKKATASTASTASSATKSAAKKTSSTAKKNAAKTKTSAKSTATSAKKTAAAAQKAVEDTAAKTGNTGDTADTPANTTDKTAN